MGCPPQSSDPNLIQNHWNELERSLNAAVAEWEQITPARYHHRVCSGVLITVVKSIKYKDNTSVQNFALLCVNTHGINDSAGGRMECSFIIKYESSVHLIRVSMK